MLAEVHNYSDRSEGIQKLKVVSNFIMETKLQDCLVTFKLLNSLGLLLSIGSINFSLHKIDTVLQFFIIILTGMHYCFTLCIVENAEQRTQAVKN